MVRVTSLCAVSVVMATIVVLAWGSSGNANDRGSFLEVDGKDWQQAVRSDSRMVVLFYKTSGCEECQVMIELVSSLIGDPDLDEDIEIRKCSDVALASSLGLSTFPTLVFLREKLHLFYDGKAKAGSLLEWLQLARSRVTKTLYDDSFEHLTQASTGATTGDWLVAFYQEDKCSDILPLMESVAVRIHQRTNVAVVDSSKNTNLALRFNIKQCPDIRLFRQGKMFRYELPKIDIANLKSFVEQWYKNSKSEVVRPPKSSFDFLTEKIADQLKSQLEGENRVLVLAVMAGVASVFVLVFVCCCKSVVGDNSSKKQKTE